MKENIHIQAIPADILTQVQTKMQEIQTLLAPYNTQYLIDYWKERWYNKRKNNFDIIKKVILFK